MTISFSLTDVTVQCIVVIHFTCFEFRNNYIDCLLHFLATKYILHQNMQDKWYLERTCSNRTVNPDSAPPNFQRRATRIIRRAINLRGNNIYYRWITINCRGTCAQTIKLSRIMVILGGGPDTSKITFCQYWISVSETGLKC